MDTSLGESRNLVRLTHHRTVPGTTLCYAAGVSMEFEHTIRIRAGLGAGAGLRRGDGHPPTLWRGEPAKYQRSAASQRGAPGERHYDKYNCERELPRSIPGHRDNRSAGTGHRGEF